MEYAIAAVVVVVFAAGIWLIARPRPVFVVDIHDRRVTVRRGKVSPRFLHECELLISAHEISHGTIKAFPSRGGVSLRFSPEIPNECHQNFRNVWHLARSG